MKKKILKYFLYKILFHLTSDELVELVNSIGSYYRYIELEKKYPSNKIFRMKYSFTEK